MKDSQYITGPPKNNNGDIMSGGGGGGGGGGRRDENRSGGAPAAPGQASSAAPSYPHWPPHPLHSSHHQFRSHHSQLPRVMGNYYSGRGMPPTVAHTASSGNWNSRGAGQGAAGLKPPERWGASSAAVSTGQPVEGGMDLSQTRSNGSQPNGLSKEVVSVIATNPLRTGDKPLDPSDRSEDEDEDCMVIEEGEEAPRTGELPPSSSRQGADELNRQMRLERDPSLAQEAPSALDPMSPPHHNPMRHPLPPSGISSGNVRPESSHHLPPSVTQPLRSDSSLSGQRASHQGLSRGESSSPHQALAKASSSTKQQESSHHLPVTVQGLQKPVSPLTHKPGSPALQAQQTLQFAKQILAQKQMQDSQILAQQKLTESTYQQIIAQQKLVSGAEAAHQLLVQQKLQQVAPGDGGSQMLLKQIPELSAVLQAHSPLLKVSSDQLPQQPPHHKPSSPSALHQQSAQLQSFSKSRTQEAGSQFREGQPAGLAESLGLAQDVRVFQPRHESASLPPNLPINIPSSLQVIPHPAGSCVSGSSKEDSRQSGLDQRPDIGSLPPQVAARLPSAESSSTLPVANVSILPEAVARLPTLEPSSLPPSSDSPPPHIGARLPLTSPPSVSSASTGMSSRVSSRLPSESASPTVSIPGQPSSPSAASLPSLTQVGEVKTPASDSQVPLSPHQSTKEKAPLEPTECEKQAPATSAGDLEEDVDRVESMLENMFQQEMSPPPMPGAQPSSAVAALTRRSPALTDDKVVEILQDRDEDHPIEIKKEIKTEVEEGSAVASGSAFMQVESELEKMFAGIVETPGDSDKPETPESSKSSKKSSSIKRSKGRPRIKKEIDKGKKNRNKSPLGDSLKLKKKFGPRTEKIKEGSNDSSNISTGQMYKWRGPYIRVSRGLDGKPSCVTLVNSSSASAEEDKDKSLDKSLKRKAPRIVEGRTKGPGLYSSTLSSKYNSTVIDVTWTCVFCNRRSHCENGLGGEPAGDLFGPYLVHIKLEQSLGGPSDADIVSEQRKRGGGKQLSLRAGGKANHSFSPPHKKSRKSSVSEKDGSEQACSGVVSKDVWVHEACAIWAPGVILVGPHLIGLDDAVSISLHSKCCVCGESGACISCLQHGCQKVCHYSCARATQWSLDEQTFHARCLNHKKPMTMSLALQQSSV